MNRFCLLLFLMVFSLSAFTQSSSAVVPATDTTAVDSTMQVVVSYPDSAAVAGMMEGVKPWVGMGDKKLALIQDVQQMHEAPDSNYIFLMVLGILIVLAYLRIAFNKDLEELFSSVLNANIAQQIFRSQTNSITITSIILQLNFIVATSLFTIFVLQKIFGFKSLELESAIPVLIFLFTLFYFGRIAVIRMIGFVFEMEEACDEYIFNNVLFSKTLGLSLIPVLFIFSAAENRLMKFILCLYLILFVLLVLVFLFRGLSTGSKMMYRSLYHFFIYVCVVEILPIFLLIKLLTKTII